MVKILGITDGVTTCDLCGKTGLYKTYAVENEHGDILYYGSTCIGKVFNVKKLVKENVEHLNAEISKLQIIANRCESQIERNKNNEYCCESVVIWKESIVKNSLEISRLQKLLSDVYKL